MSIRALFFGHIADIAGSRERELTPDVSTVRSVIDQLIQEHPVLENHKLLIAVNEEYADADTMLNEGDQVAIFTAVSGG